MMRVNIIKNTIVSNSYNNIIVYFLVMYIITKPIIIRAFIADTDTTH
jgi:hypothetical protein